MSALPPLDPVWWWAIAGLVLVIAELVAPGFFLIWIGLAAFAAAAAAALGAPLALQLPLFGIVAFALVLIAKRWFKRNAIESEDPLLNDRLARLVGQTVVAVEPVDGSGGRVRVGDSVWSARGGPGAPGARLRVVGSEDGVLLVEAL